MYKCLCFCNKYEINCVFGYILIKCKLFPDDFFFSEHFKTLSMDNVLKNTNMSV